MDKCSEAILESLATIKLMNIGLADMVRTRDLNLETGIGFEHIDPAIERGRQLLR